MSTRETLFTDGEGPLVYKDLALDITARIGDFVGPDGPVTGEEFFAALSLYDDYCAEIGMEDYQAGDTLALIAPHLLYHNITDEDVADEARTAKLVQGVPEYVAGLQRDGWNFRIISTAYRQMWDLIGQQLAVPPEHIACTELDLKRLSSEHGGSEDFKAHVMNAEEEVLAALPLVREAQEEIDYGAPVTEVLADGSHYAGFREALDNLYWTDLPGIGYKTLEAVTVVGGHRKVEAAKQFAGQLAVPMADITYVGDSITDDKMHEYLSAEGGLPIAINGNRYALRHAFAGVATDDMRNLRPVLDAWAEGGRNKTAELVAALQARNRMADGAIAQYHLLEAVPRGVFEAALADHKHFRTKVRGQATASLG